MMKYGEGTFEPRLMQTDLTFRDLTVQVSRRSSGFLSPIAGFSFLILRIHWATILLESEDVLVLQ